MFMNRSVRRLSVLVTAIVILAILVAMLITHRQTPANTLSIPSSSTVVKVGQPLPSFTLTSVQTGQSLSVSAHQNKPMFINFWATWCGPCKQETPDVVSAYRSFQQSVAFIGVNLTAEDSVKDVKAFMAKDRIQYPVLLDTDGKVADQFHVIGIPTSIFVNRKGIVTAIYPGAVSASELRRDLQQIAQS